MSNLILNTTNSEISSNNTQKQINTVSVDKHKLEQLLYIEKHYTTIIAAGAKKEIKKEKKETKMVLRDP